MLVSVKIALVLSMQQSICIEKVLIQTISRRVMNWRYFLTYKPYPGRNPCRIMSILGTIYTLHLPRRVLHDMKKMLQAKLFSFYLENDLVIAFDMAKIYPEQGIRTIFLYHRCIDSKYSIMI